jgi:hypothetical protein
MTEGMIQPGQQLLAATGKVLRVGMKNLVFW